MSFDADVYLAAAKERIAEAAELYDSRRYVLCHYMSGLAVECLLRAYRFRKDPEFDSRHDLFALYHASGMADQIPEAKAFVVTRHWPKSCDGGPMTIGIDRPRPSRRGSSEPDWTAASAVIT